MCMIAFALAENDVAALQEWESCVVGVWIGRKVIISASSSTTLHYSLYLLHATDISWSECNV